MNATFMREDWRRSDARGISDLVRAGDLLWLRGLAAVDTSGAVVGVGDIGAQTRQIFRNISRILAKADCDLSCIVQMTSYFAVSISDEAIGHAYWGARREFFGDHHPASTGVQVAALVRPEFLIEVDVVGYAPGRERP